MNKKAILAAIVAIPCAATTAHATKIKVLSDSIISLDEADKKDGLSTSMVAVGGMMKKKKEEQATPFKRGFVAKVPPPPGMPEKEERRVVSASPEAFMDEAEGADAPKDDAVMPAKADMNGEMSDADDGVDENKTSAISRRAGADASETAEEFNPGGMKMRLE